MTVARTGHAGAAPEAGRPEFGRKLELLLKRKGLTNAAFKQRLSDAHGIHQTTVDKWLHNDTMPRQRALSAVADVLGIEVPVLMLPLAELDDKMAFIGAAAVPAPTDAGDRLRMALALARDDEKVRPLLGTYALVAAELDGVAARDDGALAGLASAKLSIGADRASGLVTFECAGGADTISGYAHMGDTCLTLVGTGRPSGNFVTVLIDKFPSRFGLGTHTGLYCAPSLLHRGAPTARAVVLLPKDAEVSPETAREIALELGR